MVRDRKVRAKELKGRKDINGKSYEYEYYTLPLNLYVKKHIIEKFGKDFIVEIDDNSGVICIKPKPLESLIGIAQCPAPWAK
ncbi:MAG: hypothetical protein ACP5I6_03350 [Caldisphaera sp.]|jgi:hypothetical protein|nr:hypothetical protein [Caldisphaera sp.]PMP60952.1 MAG: hypothetical protein C0201_01145 [Caldisphaera sp.]